MMSVQNEFLIPFVLDSKIEELPIEAELALVSGVAADKIKRGGLFKKIKESLTLVSKFYWRVFVDTFEGRLILVDSLGLYGNGVTIDDFSINNIEANLRAMKESTSLNAFEESLVDANSALVLSENNYSIFDENFTKSVLKLAEKNLYQGNVDSPIILPTFENRVDKMFVSSVREINRLIEIQDELRELSLNWLAQVNSEINTIEKKYASKISQTKDDVDTRIVNYEERLNDKIDSDLQKANQAIYEQLTRFEGSTLGLSGIINPLQEEARRIIQNLPSTETPQYHDTIKKFIVRTKTQINGISSKVKELENERKQLEKALDNISKQHLDHKQQAIDEYETNKEKALSEVDSLRQKRDESLSRLIQLRDTIKNETDELVKKIQQAIDNRKFIARTSTSEGGNVAENFLIAFYLIRFKEKSDIRYFIVPPLIKSKDKNPVFSTVNMNSAIKGAKPVTDKIAAELVFDRRFKDSLDNIKATNYVATGELAGAVKEGINYLIDKKIIDKKTGKNIDDFINDLNL